MTPAVMGVLNVTPDSFSDGGRFVGLDDAVRRAEEMIAEGASVIDVGGESTRPGAAPIDPHEEQRRVLPVLEAIAPRCGDAGVRLSIDTRTRSTAERAVQAGATLINDVSASLYDVAAANDVGWVAMHMLGDPATMQRNPTYDDVVADVAQFLSERARRGVEAGVSEIWIDPGIGFGKTTEHNLELLAHLDVLVALGYPVLVGTSRKRFIGEMLARSDRTGGVEVADRLDGSLATAVWAMLHGASMVRAHEVAPTVQGARILASDFAAA